MPDQPLHPVSAKLADGAKRGRGGTTLLLAIVGRALLLLGVILVGASIFLPWLHLSTSFGDGPHEIDIDPLTILYLGAGVPLLIIALAFLLAALGILVSSLLLAFSSKARRQSALMMLLLVLAFFYAGGMLFILSIVLSGLPLTWPYYDVTIQYGAGVALLGCLCAVFGAPMVLNARERATGINA